MPLLITLHDLIPDPAMEATPQPQDPVCLDALLTMPIDQKMIRLYVREAEELVDLEKELRGSEIF